MTTSQPPPGSGFDSTRPGPLAGSNPAPGPTPPSWQPPSGYGSTAAYGPYPQPDPGQPGAPSYQQPAYAQPGYGQPAAAGPSVQYVIHQNVAQQNGKGTAGFVCGLVGLVFCWVPWFGVILAIVGLALSGAGISQSNKTGQSKGLAVAGLVCSIVALIPAIILLVIFLTAVSYL